MSQSFRRIQRAAMTLMELLIVVSILGLLALLAIPKLMDVYEKSRSGMQAYSISDVARAMENHYGAYGKYPDGLDTLLNESDEKLYSQTTTTRIHPSLAAMLTTHTVTAGQQSSLELAGVGHGFRHVYTAGQPHSDSGTLRHHFGTGTGHDGTTNIQTFAKLDTSNAAIQNIILKDLNLNANKSAGGADDTTFLANNVFLVFGVGPRNTMVGRVNQTAAIFESATPASYYARAIAVFMVPATDPTVAKPARLVGVIGPDGRTMKDSVNDYNQNTAH